MLQQHASRPYTRSWPRGSRQPARALRLHAHLAQARLHSVADRWQASREAQARIRGRLASCCDAAVKKDTRAAAARQPSVHTIMAAVLSTTRSCAATAPSPCSSRRAQFWVASLGADPGSALWPLCELLRRSSEEGQACCSSKPAVRTYDHGRGALDNPLVRCDCTFTLRKHACTALTTRGRPRRRPRRDSVAAWRAAVTLQ